MSAFSVLFAFLRILCVSSQRFANFLFQYFAILMMYLSFAWFLLWWTHFFLSLWNYRSHNYTFSHHTHANIYIQICHYYQFSSVQSLNHVQLFAMPWTTARQASLSLTNSRSSPKPMSFESVIPSNHLILCRPLLPSIFPSIRVFSNASSLHQMAKVLEFQLQHQSFQWTPRTDLL